jgi:Skp family chaperone for outer membrane proteins
MKKILITIFSFIAFILSSSDTKAQVFKAGVFDIDVMVQAMPGYRIVDSLVRVYEVDSLGVEYQYYQIEYQRLDSTYKADSALVAAGKKLKGLLDRVEEDRRKMALNLVYWQQISQNKSNNKRSQIAQPLYEVVTGAYKKILAKKKYGIILKPQTYEAGFPIDNIFLSVARELKMSQLPQELLYLGDDPDVTVKPATGTKPKTK